MLSVLASQLLCFYTGPGVTHPTRAAPSQRCSKLPHGEHLNTSTSSTTASQCISLTHVGSFSRVAFHFSSRYSKDIGLGQ